MRRDARCGATAHWSGAGSPRGWDARARIRWPRLPLAPRQGTPATRPTTVTGRSGPDPIARGFSARGTRRPRPTRAAGPLGPCVAPVLVDHPDRPSTTGAVNGPPTEDTPGSADHPPIASRPVQTTADTPSGWRRNVSGRAVPQVHWAAIISVGVGWARAAYDFEVAALLSVLVPFWTARRRSYRAPPRPRGGVAHVRSAR